MDERYYFLFHIHTSVLRKSVEVCPINRLCNFLKCSHISLSCSGVKIIVNLLIFLDMFPDFICQCKVVNGISVLVAIELIHFPSPFRAFTASQVILLTKLFDYFCVCI